MTIVETEINPSSPTTIFATVDMSSPVAIKRRILE